MLKNITDNVVYCTNAERLALTVGDLGETEKYYEVDTGNAYVVYGGAWYAI